METLIEDSEYIINRMGGYISHLPNADKSSNYTEKSIKLMKYYEQIPKSLLDKITYIYKRDFEIFGYDTDLRQCSSSAR